MGGHRAIVGSTALILIFATCCIAVSAGRAHAATPPFTVTEVDPTLAPNRSSGKLFFTYPGGPTPSQCSAAVVDAENQSVIVTAGHCVLGKEETEFSTKMVFVPGYRNGDAPFGEYPAQTLITTPQWMESRNTKYDFAAVVLGRNADGAAVEDVVGGLPIAFNQPRDQTYTHYGYPGQPSPPYDGERMFTCESAYGGDVEAASGGVPYEGPKLLSIGCDQEQGASGGAWLNPQGVVTAVATNGLPSADLLLAPYLGDVAAAVFSSASATVPVIETCQGLPVTQLGDEAGGRLVGTAGDDVISGGEKSDHIVGGAGNDTICAGGGNDVVAGGGGGDRLLGERGKDRIDGGSGRDLCSGGPAKDRLSRCP
jgi:V8-like Glu-specific endopeptidase